MEEKYLQLFLTTKDGEWVDFDEMVYLEPEDIPLDRIPKLIKLLEPLESLSTENIDVPLTAARLLSSWGDETGLNYLVALIDLQANWGNQNPHRLRGYDITCELILEAILLYQAWQAGRGEGYGEKARNRIVPTVKKIIKLSNQMPFEIRSLYDTLEDKDWHEYTEDIKEHLETILLNQKKHHWKVEDALNFLDKIDPEYTARIRAKYGLESKE